MSEDNCIKICMITDTNYILPTCVVIKSIEINKKAGTHYKIFILPHNVTQEDIEKLEAMSSPNLTVEVVKDVKCPLAKCNVNVERHVTPAALFKFYIPDIFKKMEKILYIDSDILVQKDLSELWNTDISGVYAGVIKDIMSIRGVKGHLKRLNFKEEFYFNSGVLLLNLELMRKEKITQKLVDYRLHGINHFMDQDAFNVVLGHKVKYLSLKWNMLNYYFEVANAASLSKLYEENIFDEPIKNYKTAAILHLGGKEKPWNYNLKYLTPLYKKYAKLINWKINISSPEVNKQVKSYRLFGFIPLMKISRRGGKKTWKILGLPLFKVRRMANGITTKYYILGLPVMKVSRKFI